MKLYVGFCIALISSVYAWADKATYVNQAPVIDGNADEAFWQQGPWYKIDKHILGELPSEQDFSGRYTLRWDKDFLYLLAEIQDDILFDAHPDPRERYWDDDCLEIFIDEDYSGGEHLQNDNAFAYHVGLDNQSVDIGPAHKDGSVNVRLLNEHIHSEWKRSAESPFIMTWELAIRVFDDTYSDSSHNKSVTLQEGKKLGFMLAYCDNDGSAEREHFMGSHEIKPVNGDKNLGYKDASVFGELTLVK
ncbi:sugar-binding protein [Alteromonadaceae bacterium M269]|nr:sugar-binding protein [Alteromonadaceae bacterium M269]